ncbi:KpsF/GutQ family sugar-phosphate isomerase [Candidatus Atribacteria bacterium 1244-E10-H5-B2]|nr:MAG: KpsF/GutQ family sugar-phosphate isomerase [Candidatus Atribacteria bacterium 1244-E10-H5-B2]
MDNSKILEIGRKVIKDEREVLEKLEKNLQENFILAAKLISELKGRLIVTGIGKNGHIGKKMAATFASVGIPSFFIHSTEAVHGDLGMLKAEDMVIAISNSGETQEVIILLPVLKSRGIKVISLTGKVNSTLGKNSDIILGLSCDKEACPFNLAPTSSSTATLVLGDALALTASRIKGFTKADYALNHPGGSLGKKARGMVK